MHNLVFLFHVQPYSDFRWLVKNRKSYKQHTFQLSRRWNHNEINTTVVYTPLSNPSATSIFLMTWHLHIDPTQEHCLVCLYCSPCCTLDHCSRMLCLHILWEMCWVELCSVIDCGVLSILRQCYSTTHDRLNKLHCI